MPAATAQKCHRGRDGESVVGQRQKKEFLRNQILRQKRNKKILHFMKQNCNFKLSMIYKKGALFLNEDQSYNNSNLYYINFRSLYDAK